jgi:hypothetical protein
MKGNTVTPDIRQLAEMVTPPPIAAPDLSIELDVLQWIINYLTPLAKAGNKKAMHELRDAETRFFAVSLTQENPQLVAAAPKLLESLQEMYWLGCKVTKKLGLSDKEIAILQRAEAALKLTRCWV